MRRWLVLSSLVLSLAATMGCAKASTLREDLPVHSGLSRYPSASVETKLEGDAAQEAPGFDGRLTERVIEHLKSKQVFAKVEKVSADPADFAVKMTITKAFKGSSMNQLVGTMGDATVDVTVELFDKESKPAGRFQVHSDSSRTSTMSVNGVDTQTGSNPLNRAVDSAAVEIGDYLAGKK